MNARRFHLQKRFDRAEARGFTLIEVTISAALMAMIIVTAYLCLSACISSQKALEPRLEVIQNARVAMALMTADLRAACPLDKNDQFIGMQRKLEGIEADNLDFATHNYTPRRRGEGDFCEVSFFLDKDRETGQIALWRRRNPIIAPDPLSGGSREEIATGVLGLQFEYYDGFDWYDAWGDPNGLGRPQAASSDAANSSGMPEAVRITLWLDSNPKARKPDATGKETKLEPPMVFQTVACLNLAAASQASPTGGSSDNSQTGQEQTSPNQGGQTF